MKPIKFILILSLLFIFANAAFAQSRLAAKVVEVIDAKTVVVELQTGKRVITELQYIDIPDREQPLYQTVKQHLQNLVLDKVVEFKPNGVSGSKTIGKIYLNGIDISMQMIRDGAAWHLDNGQTMEESSLYQSNQDQAKADKIGVWAIQGMKSPKEFKAQMEAEIREAAKIRAEIKKPVDETHSKPRLLGREAMERANASVQIWPEVNKSAEAGSISPFLLRPDIKPDYDGLYTISNPDKTFGAVVTPQHFIEVSDGKGTYSSLFSIGRIYGDMLKPVIGVKDGDYMLSIIFLSEEGKFTKSKNVAIGLMLGKEKLDLVSMNKAKRKVAQGVLEEMIFKVDQKTFNKIAKADNIKITLGKYSGSLQKPVIASVKSLRDREP